MGVFDGYAKRMLRPGNGPQDPIPKKGAKRLFFVFSTHFWKLAVLNILFIVFCIPVVTAPASLCGMIRVIYNLFTEGTSDVAKEFLAEFRRCFRKSLLPGLIGLVGLGGGGFAISFYYEVGETFGTIGLVLAIAIVIWVWVFLNHLFYQIAVIDLPLKTLMKNARILSVGQAKYNLLLLLVCGGILFLMAFLLPLSALPLVFIVFSFCQLCACTILYESLLLCIQ